MERLCVGKLRLGVGLDWVLASDGQDLKSRLAGRRFAAWVRYPSSEGLLVGLLDQAGRTLRAWYAGALLVARAAPDAIVHQTLSSGRVWTSVLVNGIPLPGTDRISELAQASALVAQHRQVFPAAVLVGDHAQARQSLPDILGSLTPAQRRPATLKARHGWFSWALLLIFCVSALTLRAMYWSGDRQPDAPVMSGAPLQPEQERQAQLQQTYLQQQASLREQHLHVGSLSAVAQLWLNQIEDLPPSLGGYRASQLICVPRSCDIDWTPTQGVLLQASLLPGEMSPEQSNGKMRTRVFLSGGAPFHHTVLSREALAQQRAMLPVRLQQLGGRAEFGEPGAAMSVQPPQGLKAPVHVLGQPVAVRVSVTGWVNARGVLGILSAVGVMPDKAVFGISNGKVSMQFEGHHVVVAR